MKITEIKPGKHNTFYIFSDGQFLFSAYAEILSKYSIKTGNDIPESELETARKEQNRMYAVSKALDILSRADYSEKGLYKKLLEKDISEEDAAHAVGYAVKQSYVNDREFLSKICPSLIRSKGYGDRRITEYLIQKGFSKDDIEEALHNTEHDPVDMICTLLENMNLDFSDRKNIDKAYRKLTVKGFSYSDINSAISRISDEDYYGD